MKIYASTQYPIEDEIRPYVGKDLWLKCTFQNVPGFARILSIHHGGPNFMFNFLPKSFIESGDHAMLQSRSLSGICSVYAGVTFAFPLYAISSDALGLVPSDERERVLRFADKPLWVATRSAFIQIARVNGVVVHIHALSKYEVSEILDSSRCLAQDRVDYLKSLIEDPVWENIQHIDVIHLAQPIEVYTSEELLDTLSEHPVISDGEDDNDDD